MDPMAIQLGISIVSNRQTTAELLDLHQFISNLLYRLIFLA